MFSFTLHEHFHLLSLSGENVNILATIDSRVNLVVLFLGSLFFWLIFFSRLDVLSRRALCHVLIPLHLASFFSFLYVIMYVTVTFV